MNLICAVLKKKFPLRTKAIGSSMLPLIRPGDGVVIQPIKAAGAGIGDILAYSNGHGGIVCHRLVKIQDPNLITKGDARMYGYERIPFSSVLGRVISIERGRSRLNLETGLHKFLSPRISWISFNMPVLLFIAAYFLRSLEKRICYLRRLSKQLTCTFLHKENNENGIERRQ